MQTKLKLFLAVFIVSWSSILIRWMGPVDPLIISFYRLLFSALFLLPFAQPFRVSNPQNLPLPNLTESDKISHWPLIALAGFFLALHFYSWIASLQITTVARSIFLESTHPIFAVILSALFLKEKAPGAFLPALLLGLLGMYLTVHQDIAGGHSALAGDALALFSAFCMAAYLIIARNIGHKIPLIRYLFFVYASAALFLWCIVLFKGLSFWDMSATVWGLLLVLSAGPSLTGHSLLNWASRRMPVYIVNMALLLESVLATAMAVVFLAEIPDPLFLAGAILILISIGWVFLKERTGNSIPP